MHLEEKCIFVTYLWNRFTDAMNLIRYEMKSASRNMTHAFGKITSVVWIQSLWQPTANDTGGNFFRQWRWAKLLSAGATNWQIGTKSRLEEINAWRQKYCCWCVYALLKNVTYLLTEREHRDTSKYMHQSQKPKAVSSLSAVLITTIHVRMWWWQCCVSVCLSKFSTPHPNTQSVLVTMTTPAPQRERTSKMEKKREQKNKRLNWCGFPNKMRMDVSVAGCTEGCNVMTGCVWSQVSSRSHSPPLSLSIHTHSQTQKTLKLLPHLFTYIL